MAQPERLADCRILIVEDEMLVAISVEDALLDGGFDVVGPAPTVDTALSLLEKHKVDAAVLDMNLGGQSGEPVARALAKNGVPFLILSGYGAAALAALDQQALVLPKPFDPEVLRNALRRLISAGATESA